jgi:DNA-binding response OmpR family regulator
MSNYTGRILIAEDENDIAQIVKYLLENKGNEVLICKDGQEALDAMPDFKPDLLILDVMMPKMSGYALVKEIKKDENLGNIPILMVSGISKGSDKPDEFWQKGMGVDDYITKPFEPKDLVQRVENLIRKKQEGWLEKERSGALHTAIPSGGTARVSAQPSRPSAATATSTPVIEEYPANPEDVVKRFVESWNNQQFELEYDCLASRLAFTSKQEYVGRRRSYFAELNSREDHRQLVQRIASKKVSGSTAQVEIVRLDTEGNSRRLTKESYILVQEDGKWKINAVKAGN